MTTYRITLLPGDGVGREIVPEAVRVLRLDSSLAAGGEEALKSLVPKALDRHTNQCNLYRYGLQSG